MSPLSEWKDFAIHVHAAKIDANFAMYVANFAIQFFLMTLEEHTSIAPRLWESGTIITVSTGILFIIIFSVLQVSYNTRQIY